MSERVRVDPSSLSVTHICDGEEVVTGGDDGQTWVATFASRLAADMFLDVVKATDYQLFGERPAP